MNSKGNTTIQYGIRHGSRHNNLNSPTILSDGGHINNPGPTDTSVDAKFMSMSFKILEETLGVQTKKQSIDEQQQQCGDNAGMT